MSLGEFRGFLPVTGSIHEAFNAFTSSGIYRNNDSTNQQRIKDYPSAFASMQWVFPFMLMCRRLSPNCCDCTAIHSVNVAGHSAEFTHHDPLTHINMGGPAEAQDCHRHAELKRKIYSALQESDEGELSIAVPREVALKQSLQSAFGATVSEGIAQIHLLMTRPSITAFAVATPEPQTPGPSQANLTVTEFSPIVVNITYSLRNPVDGFEFVLPTESYPYVSTRESLDSRVSHSLSYSAFHTHIRPRLPLIRLGVGCLALTTSGKDVRGSLSSSCRDI